ncbi:MAG: Na+-dependent transporter [Thermodesulfobacteriota bacterium]|jgi:BASS family bile acid:Na+ symporter
MSVIGILAAVLAWTGRQGTRAIAALVLIGIAFPPIDALLKPFVTEAIFLLLCIAFLRMDLAALRGYLKRPAVVLVATAWTMLAIPSLFGIICAIAGLEARSPDLLLAIMLQGAASPMMAAPAFAALMGLDATLVLVTLVASTALTPLTAPLFTLAFTGPALTLSPLALGIKLFVILSGSALIGLMIRRITGLDIIERFKNEIDGLNILILFVFVGAVMENVAASFFSTPLETMRLLGLSFLIYFAVLIATTLLFLWAGRERAFALGFMASQRNMGLMLAAAGAALPHLAWLYFALSQFPIYLSPQLLRSLARRLTAPSQKVTKTASKPRK